MTDKLNIQQTTDLLPPRDIPPMSAADALHRVDVMISLMTGWTGKGQQAQLMRGWGRWMEGIRPYVADAAARSNQNRPETTGEAP